jgi:type II secretory pathway pseudopilin PulG
MIELIVLALGLAIGAAGGAWVAAGRVRRAERERAARDLSLAEERSREAMARQRRQFNGEIESLKRAKADLEIGARRRQNAGGDDYL